MLVQASDGRLDNLVQAVISRLVLHPGSRLLVESIDVDNSVVEKIGDLLFKEGIVSIHSLKSSRLLNQQNRMFENGTYDTLAGNEVRLLDHVDGILGLRQVTETAPTEYLTFEQKKRVLTRFINPVHNKFRNSHKKWLYLRFPSESMARNAEMTPQEIVGMFFDAVMICYDTLEKCFEPLKRLLEETDSVSIKTEATDLEFSIKGIPVYSCVGRHNLPDGEVHTAPRIESMNGVIHFNVPSIYNGELFNNIKLTVRSGKVVEYSAGTKDQTRRLSEILKLDKGARYFGEFSFGLNPLVTKPVHDLLFDEKIHGAIHFALGNAYPFSDNGNKSSIHWDLVLDLRNRSGRSSICCDGEEVMVDGYFVRQDLLGLNRDRLLEAVTSRRPSPR
jgi:aminopeptidase